MIIALESGGYSSTQWPIALDSLGRILSISAPS